MTQGASGTPRQCPRRWPRPLLLRELKWELGFLAFPILRGHWKNFYSSEIHLKLIFYACAKDLNLCLTLWLSFLTLSLLALDYYSWVKVIKQL